MECTGLIVEKFIKYLAIQDMQSDEMRLPHDFVTKYSHRLPEQFSLKLRTGYELPVVFNRETGRITGLHAMYWNFHLQVGDMLVFEYNGNAEFNLYIIGSEWTELEYPSLVHYSQKSRPRVVSIRNGGLKFVHLVNESDPLNDEFAYQTFMFSNGKKISGLYNRESRKFSGLSQMCSILGIADYGNYNMLLFSYDEIDSITVSVFDDNFVEILLPGTPMSLGENSHSPNVEWNFDITIQDFHMNLYCHGVDISAEYKSLWIMWNKTDYISVYSGDRAWKLQVRHRSKWERTTIHDGWIEFRNALELEVGDLLIFEAPIGCSKHFVVRVIRNND